MLFVGADGTRRIDIEPFQSLSLVDFCLALPPMRAADAPPPDQAHVLAPFSFYALLARYFKLHTLDYSLCRLHSPQGELILFQIRSTHASPRPLPAYVLRFLGRLPGVVVLETVRDRDERHFMVQHGHQYPLHLGALHAAFDPGDVVLFTADHYPSLRLVPPVEFFKGDSATEVLPPNVPAYTVAPGRQNAAPLLQLPLQLRRERGPIPPISALLLTSQELVWLRQMLYRLPAGAFAEHLVAWDSQRAVILGLSRPVEELPFGLPQRRVGDSTLFLPLRSRLVPDLSWALLREALGLSEDTFTLLTPELRLDVPRHALADLSTLTTAPPVRSHVTLELHPSPLPPLDWSPTEPLEDSKSTPVGAPGTGASGLPGWRKGLARLLGLEESRQSDEGTPIIEAKRSPLPGRSAGDSGRPEQDAGTRGGGPVAPEAALGQTARELEATADYLAAAVCHALSKRAPDAARCFALAAEPGKRTDHDTR